GRAAPAPKRCMPGIGQALVAGVTGPGQGLSTGARLGCRIRAVRSDTRWAEVRARRGLVATPHALASEAGLRALRRGGNALDAAIAAAATIAVVYPHMNGIGGDNVWLIHDAGSGALRALRGT